MKTYYNTWLLYFKTKYKWLLMILYNQPEHLCIAWVIRAKPFIAFLHKAAGLRTHVSKGNRRRSGIGRVLTSHKTFICKMERW